MGLANGEGTYGVAHTFTKGEVRISIILQQHLYSLQVGDKVSLLVVSRAAISSTSMILPSCGHLLLPVPWGSGRWQCC